ncbi:hypothetical protein QUF80_01915 [Desulfococcaceae bacterium HSG8]|nr:hypothetical protein [Desulfococcaceae bacterium HSG8]
MIITGFPDFLPGAAALSFPSFMWEKNFSVSFIEDSSDTLHRETSTDFVPCPLPHDAFFGKMLKALQSGVTGHSHSTAILSDLPGTAGFHPLSVPYLRQWFHKQFQSPN